MFFSFKPVMLLKIVLKRSFYHYRECQHCSSEKFEDTVPTFIYVIIFFRLMLFKLYQDTREGDFEKMKQYCSLRLQDLPSVELERVPNALELFTLLVDYAVICTDDVNFLYDAVETLGSKHMLELVTGYKGL